jgi:hypothetical protein
VREDPTCMHTSLLGSARDLAMSLGALVQSERSFPSLVRGEGPTEHLYDYLSLTSLGMRSDTSTARRDPCE